MATTNTHDPEHQLKIQPTRSNDIAEHDEKPVPRFGKTDYSGAHEKTDPKEIALVKKLDRWIMVSLSQHSGMKEIAVANQSYTAYALEHVLAQLPGPQCHCFGSPE